MLAGLPFMMMLQSKLRKCMCFILGAEVRRQFSVEEEDELLQFAIQQSLIEAGSEKDEVLIKSTIKPDLMFPHLVKSRI
jgi:hypothetical protein